MPAASEMPNLPEVPCLCHDAGPTDDGPGCMCGASERVLRHVIRGRAKLSAEQRAWCIDEVASVEGYTRADCEGLDDAELGNTVFSAWTDYARDKGLM
jgi:hypothetical protein